MLSKIIKSLRILLNQEVAPEREEPEIEIETIPEGSPVEPGEPQEIPDKNSPYRHPGIHPEDVPSPKAHDVQSKKDDELVKTAVNLESFKMRFLESAVRVRQKREAGFGKQPGGMPTGEPTEPMSSGENKSTSFLDIQNDEQFQNKMLEIAEEVFSADPTPNKSYVSWIGDRVIKELIPLEDLYKATNYISVFNKLKLKKEPGIEYDINKYKDLPALFAVIEPHMERIEELLSDNELISRIPPLFVSDKYMVYVPKTYRQACTLGSGTQWCTSADSNQGESFFKSYSAQGALIIFYPKDKNYKLKFQYHKESNQFKDYTDSEITNFEWMDDKLATWFVTTFKDKWEIAFDRGLPVPDILEGDINFGSTKNLIELPPNVTKITGSANFEKSKVKSLNNLMEIGASLTIGGSKVQNLGALRKVGGDFRIYHSTLKSLENLTEIGGDAFLSFSSLTDLGALRKVNGDLWIGFCPLSSLGHLKSVKKLHLEFAKITDFGELSNTTKIDFGSDTELEKVWKKRIGEPESPKKKLESPKKKPESPKKK